MYIFENKTYIVIIYVNILLKYICNALLPTKAQSARTLTNSNVNKSNIQIISVQHKSLVTYFNYTLRHNKSAI